MRCASQQELVRAELGELTVNQLRTLDEHVAACSGCARARKEIRQLAADLSRVPAPIDGDEFVAKVMTARAQEPVAHSRSRVYFPMFAAAALVLLVAGSVKLLADRPDVEESWTARGQGNKSKVSLGAPASEVLVMRAGKLLPLSGQTLSSVDAFAVRYLNPTRQTQYLAAFAVDAAGAVHWIFPEYLDAATDPSSVALAPSTDERLLPQLVAPERPAPGPMRVFTLVSPKPTSVKRVEERLRDAPATATARALAQLVANAQLREWACSWSAR